MKKLALVIGSMFVLSTVNAQTQDTTKKQDAKAQGFQVEQKQPQKLYVISEQDINQLFEWIDNNLVTKQGRAVQQYLSQALKPIETPTEKKKEEPKKK